MITPMRAALCISFCCLLLICTTTIAFSPIRTKVSFRRKSIPHLHVTQLDRNTGSELTVSGNDYASMDPRISIQKYKHKDWNLTYLYKEAAPGRENDKPIVLVHPVGVGISSCFWTELMAAYKDNPPIYAPDLIGCGLKHGGDEWEPEKKGMFFPLSWVEGVETLMQSVVIPRWQQQGSWSNFFRGGESNQDSNGCLVIAQGGLAPVGVMLAKRNPLTVGDLMLTSPPSYTDMTTAVPQKELETNFNFLRSPIFGNIAFSILESKEIIRFFSDLFLFMDKCDDRWLDETEQECCREARAPICAFNAGLLQHRSFEDELREMTQNTLIVSGKGDKRVEDREKYSSAMAKCSLKSIEGLNVMPWENPGEVVRLIKELGY